MEQYVIRTKSGEKGPFSADQIQSFVDAGKIPGRTPVYDSETGEAVLAEQLCWYEEETSEVAEEVYEEVGEYDEYDEAADEYDQEEYEEDYEAEEPEPGPRRAVRPSTKRQAPKRGSSSAGRRGAPTRGAGRRGTLPKRGVPADGALPFRRKKSNLPAIIMIVIMVAAVGGGLYYFGPEIWGQKLEGTWVLDVDRTMEEFEARESEAGGDEASIKVGAAAMRGMLKLLGEMKFVISTSSIEMHVAKIVRKGSYTKSTKGKKIEVSVSWEEGAKKEDLVFTFRGRYLVNISDEFDAYFKR